jgi:hypothetical protein
MSWTWPAPLPALQAFLRFQAAVMGLAFVFVFVPTSWMAAIHDRLGIGALPASPIVEYLTRSLSALYGVYGSLAWVTSSDPRRYRAVVLYMAIVAIAWGPLLAGIDHQAGMPLFWLVGELLVPPAGGVIVLALLRRLDRSPA